jgi:hypothetical protein
VDEVSFAFRHPLSAFRLPLSAFRLPPSAFLCPSFSPARQLEKDFLDQPPHFFRPGISPHPSNLPARS